VSSHLPKKEQAPPDSVVFAQEIEAYRLERRIAHFAMFGQTPREAKHQLEVRPIGERLPKRPKHGNGIAWEEAVPLLEMTALLLRNGDDFDQDGRKGQMIACRLLGLFWSAIDGVVGDTVMHGAEAAAKVWAPFMGTPDERYVGWVYTAEVVGRPDVIKVGFSRNPQGRGKRLAYEEGRPVRILTARAGTMMHEWALHRLIPYAIKPEWYHREHIPHGLFIEKPGARHGAAAASTEPASAGVRDVGAGHLTVLTGIDHPPTTAAATGDSDAGAAAVSGSISVIAGGRSIQHRGQVQ
jgi:hypothetical protein